MDVTYAIIKVYVIERNDIIESHSNFITIWQTSAIEVTALLKNLHSQTVILGTEFSIYPSHPDRSL